MRLLTYVAWFALAFATPSQGQEITFDDGGAGENLADDLRAASLAVTLQEDDDTTASDFVAAARADYRRLLTALYARGYYGGTISIKIDGAEAANIAPLNAPTSIQTIAVVVDPGPRFTFGIVNIGPLLEGTELPENFRTGENARSGRITRGVGAAVSNWRDAGYAKASAGNQQIVAVHETDTLDVDVTINTGPRLTFGPVAVTGNVDVRTARILAIAGLPTGEVYDPTAIEAAQRRLRKSGAFDSVALTEADAIGAGDTLPITVQVVEAKKRRFGFGAEYISDDGLTLSSYWLHRNFFGGAERVRFDAEVSGIGGSSGGPDYLLGGSLSIPSVLGPETDFVLSSTLRREDEETYLLEEVSVEGTLTRLIREDLEVTGGLGLVTARETTDAGTRTYTLLTAPLGATLDRRDSATDSKNGYYINATVTPFVSVDGADSGAQFYTDTRGYLSFGEEDRFTLALRGQLGSLVGTTIADAPTDFLFYSGGSGTVRGQKYESLSIETTIDGVDVERGGLSFAGAQFESRIGVTDSIGVVGFYDVGLVGETSDPFGESEWHAGAGIGLRYNTGIGPIRFDIATPASGDNVGEQVEIYIGIGQTF